MTVLYGLRLQLRVVPENATLFLELAIPFFDYSTCSSKQGREFRHKEISKGDTYGPRKGDSFLNYLMKEGKSLNKCNRLFGKN